MIRKVSKWESISKQRGSIGHEMWRCNLIGNLKKFSKGRYTPLEVVDKSMNTSNLSKKVLPKFEEFRSNIATMDFAAAIRYSANFCAKGYYTFIPQGSLGK